LRRDGEPCLFTEQVTKLVVQPGTLALRFLLPGQRGYRAGDHSGQASDDMDGQDGQEGGGGGAYLNPRTRLAATIGGPSPALRIYM
jgi:hypothetical protein